MNIFENLSFFRASLQKNGLDAFIFPSNDPHQSEYVAPHWLAREWITGFDGSAGIAVITATEAGLWTDSRYFLQAEQQLDETPVQFHRQIPSVPNGHLIWLKERLKTGQKVGIDGNLFTTEGLEKLQNILKETGIEIDSSKNPLVDAWKNRPPLPSNPIFDHPVQFAGLSRAAKLEEIRTVMRAKNAKNHLLVPLDDIAWTFNLRGSDVESNPVFYAYSLIGLETATLFVGLEKIDAALKAELAKDGIELSPYEAILDAIQQLDAPTLLDKNTISLSLLEAFPDNVQQIVAPNPSTLAKALKNATELKNLRACMEKDGKALLRLMMWLEETIQENAPTEHEVAVKLAGFRAEMPHYFGESFAAIAGYAGNGAIVHYHPSTTASARLKPEGVFLLDSGGQYLDGTTDITRTIALGSIPTAAKIANTKVLKGHIALAQAKFPKGTAGIQLDILARMHLWADNMDYGHGTGHGVGFFLNVHEGPHGISQAVGPRSKEPLLPGMVISNEPGFYETGEFGIRIENLVLVVDAGEGKSGPFYAFETLSLFPMDMAMIDQSLLTTTELRWLKDYHQMVLERLSPHLNAKELNWLEQKCTF